MMTIPKYAILEIERRWLARPERLPDLHVPDSILVEDIYFPGTRLRLRKMTGNDGAIIYKLGKKYGKISTIEEPITNIYLDEKEYELLAALPGHRLARRRYHYPAGNQTYYINVIVDGEGPVIVEAEYQSRAAAQADTPPDFCGVEISASAEFEAHRLATTVDDALPQASQFYQNRYP